MPDSAAPWKVGDPGPELLCREAEAGEAVRCPTPRPTRGACSAVSVRAQTLRRVTCCDLQNTPAHSRLRVATLLKQNHDGAPGRLWTSGRCVRAPRREKTLLKNIIVLKISMETFILGSADQIDLFSNVHSNVEMVETTSALSAASLRLFPSTNHVVLRELNSKQN